MAIVLVLLTLIFVALAITYVLVGKIALFILLGLAPLFIAMALFEFSSALFSGWLRTCAQYAIVPAIVYGVLGFLLTLMTATVNNLGGITDVSSGLTVIAPFLILCLVGSFILPLSLSIAASIAGGHALHNALPGTAMRGVRDYAYWRIARGWRNGGGARSEPPALPPPHATITQGAATISPGAGSRDFSADPRAEQVAGALIEARVAQARARNREG
jgi:type IV secretion system protein VirB6